MRKPNAKPYKIRIFKCGHIGRLKSVRGVDADRTWLSHIGELFDFTCHREECEQLHVLRAGKQFEFILGMEFHKSVLEG